MAESSQGRGAVLAAWIGLILGPLLLLACILTDPPGGLSEKAWLTVGLAALMAVWWSTEAIPIPATSLLPILLIPLLDIDTLAKATAPYANPTIFLFLGGFLLGLAMQRWNLHKRIALATLLAVGNQPSRQIAGFMIATAFISMWVSNTATSIMMLPIGLSVIGLLIAGSEEKEGARFAVALLLGIAYSASVGGIATLIGTPPNALLAAFMRENYDVQIGFGQWMLLGLPLSIGMLVFIWWSLTRGGFRLAGGDSRGLLEKEMAALGPMSRAEKMVAVVFVLAAAAWIFQPLLADYIDGVNDTSIAMAAAIALFLIPVDLHKRVFLMDWEQANKAPWGVLLLFGGGLSLAGVIGASGLAEWIASSLGAFDALPLLAMIALVVTVIIFLTEITSNTATAAAFLPLLGALAVAQGLSPEMLAIPAAVAASCAFMMPVATPPNAIVFGTGQLPIQAMIKAGFVLNLFGVLLVSLLCYGLVGWIWAS
ncbi:DASS family sodium-coupled anion symporter [Pseudomonas stutzeri]|uniref:DASS family sodium-coupled anion symporter n=1 Tax=Stutzerimonas stutzeri TaxID=316 RepID=A0AA42H251_STUST|nr:DASS family sodium-coupled anion symporter [Stutzerimonas stutzeri]MCF0017987.1 DASS family sodium-coupled anion symporter [Stutzerimonas stutzeri]MCF0020156.1 DASS family sodium-coupled anion symporter [Stutzerimonas stutzeri]MDH0144861.1 DASS family sodium-coupled anion symporter [Stutzerimonas stutzeri]MDH0149884.1 DASS family sodium-coupled anion symporter [Stutzerimonas stutzeri]MDH0607804.1 DASS family sodium-coupled anion symporter [Stutzerimonas stutzeri]